MPRRLPGAPAALVDIFRATCQAGQGDRSPPAPAGALSGTQLPLSPPPPGSHQQLLRHLCSGRPSGEAPLRWAVTRAPTAGAERPLWDREQRELATCLPRPLLLWGEWGWQERRAPCHAVSGGPPAARNQEGSVQAASGRLGFLIPSPAGPRAWDMAKPLPGPTGRPQVLSMRSSSPDPRD